jgi:hypothetical protein
MYIRISIVVYIYIVVPPSEFQFFDNFPAQLLLLYFILFVFPIYLIFDFIILFQEKMPDCEYYEKGNCFKENCLYRHVKFNDDTLQCDKFQKGFCPLGTSCTLRHVYKSTTGAGNGSKDDKNDQKKAVKYDKKNDLNHYLDIPLLDKGTKSDDYTMSSTNFMNESDVTTKVPSREGDVDHENQINLDIEHKTTLSSDESNISQINMIKSDDNDINIQETELFIPFTERSSRSLSDEDYLSFPSSSASRKRERTEPSDENDDKSCTESESENENDSDDDGDTEVGSDGESIGNIGMNIEDGLGEDVDVKTLC